MGRPLGHLDGAWVAVVAAAELSTYPAYALAYRSVTGLGGGARLRAVTVARIVIAGFGPLAVSGGFAIDRPALAALGGDAAAARHTVAAIGVGAWDGGGWLRRRLPARATALGHVLTGVAAVATLARAPRRHAGAWAGTALYWAAEVAALSAALRAAGLHLGVGQSLLAYSTGYLASRRSLPLGGAGLTEALLLYSLAQLHEPLGPATAAVIIYRAFNFVVTIGPALLAYRGLAPA